jgi:hypothetical protein
MRSRAVANTDDYCLNVYFLAENEQIKGENEEVTYDTKRILYDNIFSSEQSVESQRPMEFDNHFKIVSKHVLGYAEGGSVFEGEIFGF